MTWATGNHLSGHPRAPVRPSHHRPEAAGHPRWGHSLARRGRWRASLRPLTAHARWVTRTTHGRGRPRRRPRAGIAAATVGPIVALSPSHHGPSSTWTIPWPGRRRHRERTTRSRALGPPISSGHPTWTTRRPHRRPESPSPTIQRRNRGSLPRRGLDDSSPTNPRTDCAADPFDRPKEA
jgi:hypothetical protein